MCAVECGGMLCHISMDDYKMHCGNVNIVLIRCHILDVKHTLDCHGAQSANDYSVFGLPQLCCFYIVMFSVYV